MSRYDVAVVGAGIHGAGVAQAAAARGYKVLLIEKQGLAAGTSSRSSKLIHGGLRYLENGQLLIVRESLHERSLLLRLAPDLVQLRRFYLPVYPKTRRRPWQLAVGLSLYSVLAGFRRGTGFSVIPRRRWGELDGLETRDLDAVIGFWDGQTDDALLTRAVVRSASELGTELAMPAEFLTAEVEADRCVIHYLEGGWEKSCEASTLVNAAGPWASQVAAHIRPVRDVPPIELVQGTHILLPRKLERGIYYVESPRDGRAIFVMPWRGQTLVGTTETRYRGDPDHVRPLNSEKHYLLSVYRHYFRHAREYSMEDISAATAGLRVLPAGGGHAFHRSRRSILQTDRTRQPRVIGIFGGKLTTYRIVAEKVVDRLVESLPRRKRVADTARLVLQPD